jgi:hypothetical protein
MLPSAKAVESQEISKRGGFAEIEDELKEVALLVSDLTPHVKCGALLGDASLSCG